MSDFDLDRSIRLYVQKLCRGIRRGKRRREVEDELFAHIEDTVLEFMYGGMTEEEAFKKAVEAFGTPDEITELLWEVNNRRKIKIPPDIKKYVRMKILWRMAKCLIWLSIIAILLYFFGERLFADLGIYNRLTIYAILFVLPFVFTGFPLKFIDSSWVGDVIKVDVVSSVDSSSGVKPTRETLYHKNTVYLSIRTESGRVIRRKLYEGSASKMPSDNIYKVGDRVIHIYGTNHIGILTESHSEGVICFVCGLKNPMGHDCCVDCSHTLMKEW